jgi:hypothetical protein
MKIEMSIMLILFPSLRPFIWHSLLRLAIKNISVNYRSPIKYIISVSLYASNSIQNEPFQSNSVY